MSTQRQQRQQELEQLVNTFATDGWRLFVSECQGLLEHHRATAASDCETTEKWFTRRGAILNLEQILMYAPAAVNELANIDKIKFDDEPEEHEPNELED